MTSSRPLRIAAFSAVDLSLPQGDALHLRGILDALAARGHDVALVAPRPARARPDVRFRVLETPVLRAGALVHLSFEFLGGARLLARCLRRRPDAILLRQDIYSGTAAAVARLLKIPLAVEVDSSIPDELALWGSRTAARLARASERFCLRRASAVLVLSGRLGRIVAARTGIDPARVTEIEIATHLPASVDAAAARAAAGVRPGTFVAGFAGNLTEAQGVEVAVEAVSRLAAREVELWVIGAGVREQALRALAAPLGTRVRFFGALAREEADRLLAACQILVAPYLRDAYDRIAGGAISSKVLAYLASDRPVLISDMPYYAWIAEIGAGEAFASGDAASLAGRIAAWEERWRAAGAPLRDWPWAPPGPGRRWIERGRTWDHAAARMEEILRRLAADAA